MNGAIAQSENHEMQFEPNVADQILKRVRKLHWVGLEKDARRLKMALADLIPADSVPAAHRDTD